MTGQLTYVTEAQLRQFATDLEGKSPRERTDYLVERYGLNDATRINRMVLDLVEGKFTIPPATPTENPKATAGRKKIEHHHTPRLPALYQAAIHELGARKYGSFNWREKPIKLTDYIDAVRRHLDELEAGVDLDAESGLPHLAHVMATAAIVIDAAAHDTLIDDRKLTPLLVAEMARIAEVKKGWPAAA